FALAKLVLSYAQTSGSDMLAPSFGTELWDFMVNIDLGRALAIQVVMVAILTVVAVLAQSPTGAGWLAVISIIALIPQAIIGHAAGTEGHHTAVTAMGLHLLGVAVWAGGLAVLAMVAHKLDDSLVAATQRFSTLALWAYVGVLISGVAVTWLRVVNIGDLLDRKSVVSGRRLD